MIERNYRLVLAFGSNMGHRVHNLRAGLKHICSYAQVMASSSWHATEPLSHPDFPLAHQHSYYLNFILDVATSLPPYLFYQQIIVPIENKLGHSRQNKWEPRALDIDIVLAAYNNARRFQNCTPFQETQRDFSVPHAGFGQRDFWSLMIEKELAIPAH